MTFVVKSAHAVCDLDNNLVYVLFIIYDVMQIKVKIIEK